METKLPSRSPILSKYRLLWIFLRQYANGHSVNSITWTAKGRQNQKLHSVARFGCVCTPALCCCMREQIRLVKWGWEVLNTSFASLSKWKSLQNYFTDSARGRENLTLARNSCSFGVRREYRPFIETTWNINCKRMWNFLTTLKKKKAKSPGCLEGRAVPPFGYRIKPSGQLGEWSVSRIFPVTLHSPNRQSLSSYTDQFEQKYREDVWGLLVLGVSAAPRALARVSNAR